jgi:acetolactate synthase-1/2/3 large subunit
MRVADYIWKFLADKGVKHVFLVTGGGAMHLNDALRLEKRIMPVCCHHEQACAIAAEGYYRASGRLPAVSVTTGPGGTNAITGVIGAWLDSIPMIVISGQVKFSTTIASCPDIPLRQLGDQEINIVDIVRPVTKYAKMVTEADQICDELAKALDIATSGRPGPVWLDIPLNIQGAPLANPVSVPSCGEHEPECGISEMAALSELVKASRRPVVVAGHGIELDRAEQDFMALVEKLKIPVLSTFCGMNVIPSEHPLAFGRIGTIGQRAANFVLQNADLIISIGSRNNIRQVSYNWENFGKRAKKVVVDVDPAELKKPTVKPDLSICCSAARFINAWAASGMDCHRLEWLAWCEEMRRKYPTHTSDQMVCEGGVNPYHLTAVMSEFCPHDTAVAIGNGTVSIAAFQTWMRKRGQRVFCNSGCASMGYDLPAAVGAAASGMHTVCLAGDGSIMMNLQELETVLYKNLPIKIFIFDNHGYTSIRQTQKNLFSQDFIGCDPSSGVGFPDFAKLCSAWGFKVREINSHDEIAVVLADVFSNWMPEVVVVRIPAELGFSPKLSARRLPDGTMVSPSIEDMFPFLPREEMELNVCRI